MKKNISILTMKEERIIRFILGIHMFIFAYYNIYIKEYSMGAYLEGTMGFTNTLIITSIFATCFYYIIRKFQQIIYSK